MMRKPILAISIIALTIFIQPVLSIDCDSNNITLLFEEARAILRGMDYAKYENATEIYNEISESCDPNATVWITEGRRVGSISSRASIQESTRCFDRAIEIYDESPQNATTWNNKGVALLYQADTDLERYVQYPDFDIREEHHLYRKDKYEEALACFEKAIELDPTLPIPWAHRGYALWCLSDGYDSLEYYEMIKDYYKRAVELPYRVDGCLFVERAGDAEYYVDSKITELKFESWDIGRASEYY